MVSAVRIGGVFCAAMLFGACATGAPSDHAEGEGALEGGVPTGDGTGGSSNDTGGSGGNGGTGGNVSSDGAGGGGGSSATGGAGGINPGTDGGVPAGDAALPDSCSNKVKGTGETGTDCGGACSPCENDQGCLVAADCSSLYCPTSLVCADPPLASCTDKMQNALETDVDCGGGACSACILGKKCAAPSDCSTAACTANKCVCAPKTMAAACGTKTCGTASDGCSATVSCGTCGPSETCNASGMCVTVPACVASSCTGCIPFIQSGCCKTNGTCGCQLSFGGGCS